MATITTPQAHDGSAYAALGIVPALLGDVLVLTFQDGSIELWGLADDVTAQALPWIERLHFEGRIYVQLPTSES